MKIGQAKDYYKRGVIKRIKGKRIDSIWLMTLELNDGTSDVLHTSKRETKTYTLPALLLDVERITGAAIDELRL